MEQNPTIISESDKKALLDKLDRGLPMTDIVSYSEKTSALACGYGFVALYMLYHIKQMADDKYIRSNTLVQYSNYLHRMLLVMYMLRCPIFRGTWFVAVYVDALLNGFDKIENNPFIRTAKVSIGPLRTCHKTQKTDRLLHEPEEVHLSKDFSYLNTKLLSNLRLNSEGVLSKLFAPQDDHRFDVYGFFFSKKHINAKLAPPKVWFETYRNRALRGVYHTVEDTWKTNYFALCDYTNTVKDLVLMTAYYALLKHCRFLLITWYILVDRVNLVEPSLRPSVREERKKLMQMPLPLLETIFRDLNSAMDVRNLSSIEANLNNDPGANKTDFTEFVQQVLAMYNLYAKKVKANLLSYDDWLDSFKIQNQFFYDNPSVPSFQSALMENVQILQTYYDDVIETLKPTDFAAIEYLSSVNYKGKVQQELP
ncbi:uncharacterized protein LOC126839552 [Adelges cooleyi]|uniref:uncharacterized protein LOC126839552 n=1 Tax=Adelges cooleyi TaxID=133065 RepID=UPI0021805991|nr:uncharacterized protein LOC126839552 [Adelges cooleyi]